MSPYANMTDMVNADRARSRTFVVTGAASGIGLATARRLLAEGGTVIGADLAAPPDLGAPTSRFVTADVTDEAAIAAVLAAVPDRLDGVFHAAGVAGGGPVHLLDRAEWDRVIGINLTGTFLVAKAALAKMIEQDRVDGERGSIVTVASIEGLEGTAGGSSYNAAKGGVVLLTKNIALDYGPERHPGQRHLPRLHRNADGPKRLRPAGDGGSAGLHHRGACPATARPAGGGRGDGGLPAVARRVVRQRSGHRRRRRLHRGSRSRCRQTLRLSRLMPLGFAHGRSCYS